MAGRERFLAHKTSQRLFVRKIGMDYGVIKINCWYSISVIIENSQV